ncbi:hypothetical protein UNDYM_2322 [Undibacterium sp. YM2]|uniref:DUF262 domain-containing protein n=1 Tax=Undibacterium sp. YM2 TaxID=2058625 RepID=UPI001331CA0B|nr:DUF262 domain-containing protein [Undibacterium sp. YM2]BBB66575.1 hypothetical protein UNDYM_2322 [Undibacterium sp. YM2]
MKIASELYSLTEIVEESPHWHFNIPIYQRLYVWGEDQVLTLLNDLVNAYERGEDLFFLGGTLLVEQFGVSGRHFDLIDGQQRFTTLWMLCQAWQEALKPFLTVTEDTRTQTRLKFAIRPEVNHFLETLTFGSRGQPIAVDEATKRMRTALDLMKSVFERRPLPKDVRSKEAHLTGLTDFVFGKVQFVITTVPRETDLNKLFEVINNRGVQLQHHEILKARMLDALTESERGPYAVLWEACADMDSFIERNLVGLSGLSASEVTGFYERGEFSNLEFIRLALSKKMHSQSNLHALNLESILKDLGQPATSDADSEMEDGDPTWVRSIFGFPLFLQHTLRIWLLENKQGDLPRLLDRELLTLFDEHFFQDSLKRAEDVRSFIELLWRLRVIFDIHFIKWIDQGEEEVHLISNISVSTSSGKRYVSRSRETDSHRGFSLLQSMLYHSQEITTQYWVTPLLLYMYRNPGEKTETQVTKAKRYFDYLRHLDNHLLGSAANESLVIRTRSFMEKPWQRRNLVHKTELISAKGVKFAHYWFYKLEFVLWFQRTRETEGWKKFRLTAKSSVEHISPQTPTERDSNQVDQALDCIGNLALVSRSLNSEYGNLPYNEKRQRFLNKNKTRIDSLKMDLIYENKHWGDKQAFAHQKEMIECLENYCGNTPTT